MARVLIADRMPSECIQLLEEAQLEVVNTPGLSPEELKEALRAVEGVIVRSGAKLSAEVLEAAERLRAICRAGVGVDNIDIPAASRKGIVVMNTPGANTISTAEHTFALLLALARNIGPAYISMREGKWDRKKFVGAELAGTTLGIVGLGRVGREVATRAMAFGMKVIGHDPFLARDAAAKLGVHLVESLEELLGACDYLTVHVPGGESTRQMIGEAQIAMMKPGARIINCARGEVVDQEAAVRAVREGRLAGIAFDVYASEPPEDFSFAAHDRVLATPHLGASTEAAQIAVGIQAAAQIRDALLKQHYKNAVNVTTVPTEEMVVLQPYCTLAQKLGKVVGALNRGRPRSVEVLCTGEVARHDTAPVVSHGIMGVLQSVMGESVNIISAPHLARERGLRVTASSSETHEEGFSNLVVLKLTTDAGHAEAAGAVLGQEHARIVRVGPFYAELLPEGHLLLVFAQDKPGLIGAVGESLGNSGINIARMTFGRARAGGAAMLALNLDMPCDEQALAELSALPLVERAVRLSL